MSWFSKFWEFKAKTVYGDIKEEDFAMLVGEINIEIHNVLEFMLEEAIRREDYERAERLKQMLNVK